MASPQGVAAIKAILLQQLWTQRFGRPRIRTNDKPLLILLQETQTHEKLVQICDELKS